MKEVQQNAFEILLDTTGIWITYRRGDASIRIRVVPSRPDNRSQQAEGTQYNFRAKDFLILSDDLVFDGQKVEPERNDLIEEEDSGKVYAVLPNPETRFEYRDAWDVSMRVHTEQQMGV